MTQYLILCCLLKVLADFAAGFAPSEEGGAEVACSVEAVSFSRTMPVGLTASLSGVMGVWDLPTQKLRQQCIHQVGKGSLKELVIPSLFYFDDSQSYDQQYRPGVVKVCASQLSPVVHTGSLDGVVRSWDLRNGQVVREWHGHTGHILDMALTK